MDLWVKCHTPGCFQNDLHDTLKKKKKTISFNVAMIGNNGGRENHLSCVLWWTHMVITPIQTPNSKGLNPKTSSSVNMTPQYAHVMWQFGMEWVQRSGAFEISHFEIKFVQAVKSMQILQTVKRLKSERLLVPWISQNRCSKLCESFHVRDLLPEAVGTTDPQWIEERV